MENSFYVLPPNFAELVAEQFKYQHPMLNKLRSVDVLKKPDELLWGQTSENDVVDWLFAMAVLGIQDVNRPYTIVKAETRIVVDLKHDLK